MALDLISGRQSKERRFKIDLVLTPAQAEIKQKSKRFTFLRAGRKFGKTKYAERQTLDWLAPPNAVHWHIAPTYKQAKLISWDYFKRLIPQEAMAKKPNDSDLIIQLKNNAQLYLMGSDEPDSLRGPAPTSTTLEEAAYHKAGVWDGVIRPNLTVHRAPALFISSPNGFNWFKDTEDKALEDIAQKGDASDWAVFHKTIYDNPHINRDEIEEIKKTCDPRVWSQEYMANYESSVGRVFYLFQDTDRHVRSFPMPTRSDECGRSIDWGMRDDCGILWGTLRNNSLYIYRENADHDIAPTGQAAIARGRTAPEENIWMNIIGHDAAKKDPEGGLSIQWHFQNAGIRPLKLSSRKKDASRAMIQQLLAEDRLVIHPECRRLRKQILAYSWKDTAMEKTEDGGDDLVDSLHYMVELFQYKLFINRPEEKTMSLEEKYAAIRAEKESNKVLRYPLNRDEGWKAPSFNGPAGYL